MEFEFLDFNIIKGEEIELHLVRHHQETRKRTRFQLIISTFL
ncbi:MULTISPECIES: hypothetical protein [Bacillaceae]|nr:MULTISPECIES: hypothetical protein [Bacillaceae]